MIRNDFKFAFRQLLKSPGFTAVAVLSHGFWLNRFGGDPSVVGRALELNRSSVTIIGVMPAGFDDPLLWGRVDLWRPMGFPPGMRLDANRGNAFFQIAAQLKPGVSLARARAEMKAVAARSARDHPGKNAQTGLRVVPLSASAGDETSRRVTWMMMDLAAFVLMIACANLANLQFARAAGRTHEYAIRTALGAQRGRIIRQLLTESLLLALIGERAESCCRSGATAHSANSSSWPANPGSKYRSI